MGWTGFTPEWFAQKTGKRPSVGAEHNAPAAAKSVAPLQQVVDAKRTLSGRGAAAAGPLEGAHDAAVAGAALAAGLYPLSALCRGAGLPQPIPEYEFHPTRRWRFDYAWPLHLVALEVEGGLWSKSEQARAAHAKPLAILRDMAKGNAAACLGWRILRVTPDEVRDLSVLPLIADALNFGKDA